MRFVSALSSRTRQQDIKNSHKMKEWENKLSKKNELSRYTYFGKSLSLVSTTDDVPYFVIKCTFFIEQNGLEVEGIYRRSGSKQDIEALILAFEADTNVDFSSLGFNIHIFTGALKSFFSHLPISLIPPSFIDAVIDASSQPDPDVRITKFKNVVAALPHQSNKTLTFLIHHFSKVCQYKEKNKMDARNIALCFWPTLIKLPFSVEFSKTVNGNHLLFCLFFHTLIENTHEIFGKCMTVVSEESVGSCTLEPKTSKKSTQRSVSTSTLSVVM